VSEGGHITASWRVEHGTAAWEHIILLQTQLQIAKLALQMRTTALVAPS
jgi:hypothetical protein